MTADGQITASLSLDEVPTVAETFPFARQCMLRRGTGDPLIVFRLIGVL